MQKPGKRRRPAAAAAAVGAPTGVIKAEQGAPRGAAVKKEQRLGSAPVKKEQRLFSAPSAPLSAAVKKEQRLCGADVAAAAVRKDEGKVDGAGDISGQDGGAVAPPSSSSPESPLQAGCLYDDQEAEVVAQDGGGSQQDPAEPGEPPEHNEHSEQLGDGPRSIAQVLGSITAMVEDMTKHDQEHGTTLVDNLQRHFSRGLVITTSYSGCGGAETAVAMMARALQGCHGKGAQDPKPIFYSATDNGKLQQRALLATKCQKPNHLFSDIEHRVPKDVLTAMRGVLQKALHSFRAATVDAEVVWAKRQKLCHGKASQSEAAPTAVLHQIKEDIGLKMLDELCYLIDSVEFETSCPCMVCSRSCPLNPRHQDRLRGLTWIELAGTTCVAWSNLGSAGLSSRYVIVPSVAASSANSEYAPFGLFSLKFSVLSLNQSKQQCFVCQPLPAFFPPKKKRNSREPRGVLGKLL